MNDPKLLSELKSAGNVAELTDADGRSLGVLTRTAVADVLTAARAVGEQPLFENHVRAVEEYRRLHNTASDSR